MKNSSINISDEKISEQSDSKSRNLHFQPCDSWNISIHSVVKKSKGVANADNFFDGITRLRVENVQFGYSALVYDKLDVQK